MGDWLLRMLNSPVVVVALFTAVAGAIYWVASVNIDRAAVKESLKRIEAAIAEIQKDIKSIFRSLDRPLVAGSSPLRLTELGEEIADCLEARSWAASVAPTLLESIKDLQPFQIDEFAREHVTSVASQWTRKIAECAYQFGRKTDEIPVILRVALREELLRLAGHPVAPE